MPLTPTTRLALVTIDPNPTTGDFVDPATQINANWAKIDDSVGAFPCTSGTRPTGGDRWHGRFIRETDTRRVYVWNATQAVWDLVADPLARVTKVARKTAEPTNLTTTFLQDADLRFTIATADLGRYVLDGHIMWRSSTTGDFKCRFAHSGASSFRWSHDGPSAGDVTKPEFGMVFDNATSVLGGTGSFTRMRLGGTINFTGTGTFTFEWAQNTTDAAGNTYVLQESHISLTPFA